jgi:phosphohistidine phosphatase
VRIQKDFSSSCVSIFGDSFFLLLLIIRHGKSEGKSSEKPEDERRLTEEGAAELRRNLELAKEIVSTKNIDLVLSSPYLRAKESARIVMEIFQISTMEVEKSLSPESEPYEVFQALFDRRESGSVAIVTHKPLATKLLNGLLIWDERCFDFKAGAVSILQVPEICENATGVLLGLIQSVDGA